MIQAWVLDPVLHRTFGGATVVAGQRDGIAAAQKARLD
jgi:hypothetical protein